MRVVRKIAFSCGHPAPFEVERMSLGKIERSRLAPQRLRNSFEGDDVISARRLPRVFFDFVQVNFFHTGFWGSDDCPQSPTRGSVNRPYLKSFFAIEIISLR